MRLFSIKKIGWMITFSLLFFTMLISSGCSMVGSPDSASKMKILLIMNNLDDTYRSNLAGAIMDSREEFGVSVDMVETDGSSDLEVKYVSSAKEKGYSAIICRISDNSNAPQLNSYSGDLPIIYINNQPAEEHLESDKYIFVGSNEEQAGKYQAEYVVGRLGTSAMNVVIMEGEKDHSGTKGRTDAVKAALQSHGVNANYVYVDYANWTRDEAYTKFGNFLKTGQKVDAVFCNNDLMALGVLDSMKENGIDYSTIPVVGVDAAAEGCESIMNGEMAFSVFQNSENQGKMAVEAALLLGHRDSIKNLSNVSSDRKYIWLDFEPVSASNVSKYASKYN